MSGSEDGMVKPTPVMGYGAPSRSYTAAKLHEATGLPVIVAFTAGNLEAVARSLHERYPDKRLVVAGDNDHHKERETGPDGRSRRNVGREKAEQAAVAVGGFALIPRFASDDVGTDWNDLAEQRPDAFQAQLQAGLAAAERHYLARQLEPQRRAARALEAKQARPKDPPPRACGR
jgi:putative DNA primase/helicase